MTHEERIERLFNSFPSYQVVGKRAYKPGIETMKAFDAVLGHPHRNYPTIHVAGTNGKGSVSSMMAAALSACGMKVGLYTSPHLKDFRERMKIVYDGSFEMISREEVASFLEKYEFFFESDNPSFFEITTAMAFDFFARRGVDAAVIETGLGGRLDSTNVILPELSIITNIGLEHCLHLGYTLEEIAFEKGGIIKPGVPAVIGEVLKETAPVFERIAAERGSALYFAQNYENGVAQELHSEADLQGDYQTRNLNTVLCALEVLRQKGFIDLKYDELYPALSSAAAVTGLQGRWELRRKKPGKADIICDIGHNAHGLKYVFGQLRKCADKYEKIFIIFGIVADKDLEAVIPLMLKPSDKFHYIFTNSKGERALPAAELASRLEPAGIFGTISSSVAGALELAETEAGEFDLIFVGGSNFVVAEL